jgi:hypothetical protein
VGDKTLGILKARQKPLSVRKIRETGCYANKECAERIAELDRSQELCSCPTCKIKAYVVCTGTHRGRRKFACHNPAHGPVHFSTSTSFETMGFYRDTLAKNLALLMQANTVVDGIRKLNQTSKYFVELPLEQLYRYIAEEANHPLIDIPDDADIVTIFCDLSGSGLARNKAIILAVINGTPIFEIVTTSNYLSAHQLLAAVKERLQVSKETLVVFVTDGERCFIGPIKHYFPNAIHIRQFHKKSCRGMIYAHLTYRGKVYTIRCLWDSVLDEGTPSQDVLRKREQRAKKRLDSKEIVNEARYTELSKDAMVWEGTVHAPRGVRRKLPERRCGKRTNTGSEKRNTPPPDTTLLIFKGSLEEAKELPVFSYCFSVLKQVFGGLHITSNIVENVFNVKSKLKVHRTMKFGERMLVSILYANLVLKDMDKEELIEFLKDKVVTYNFIQNKVLYGSGLQKNRPIQPSFIDIIMGAMAACKRLVIDYCDRFKRHTSRIITPKSILVCPYSKMTKIVAYCHLRKAERTFYLERMRDVAIYDPKPFFF